MPGTLQNSIRHASYSATPEAFTHSWLWPSRSNCRRSNGVTKKRQGANQIMVPMELMGLLDHFLMMLLLLLPLL
jgi:hypothetical protein